jgi:hypothetical protein
MGQDADFSGTSRNCALKVGTNASSQLLPTHMYYSLSTTESRLLSAPLTNVGLRIKLK